MLIVVVGPVRPLQHWDILLIYCNNQLKKYITPLLRLARWGHSLPPPDVYARSFLCPFFTSIKLCYTKALEWSTLVPGPEAKSSLEITHLMLFTVSYEQHCALPRASWAPSPWVDEKAAPHWSSSCICPLSLSQHLSIWLASLMAQSVKNLPAMLETQVWSLGWEDTLEREMATRSSILAWRIPWTEEIERLQSMELQELDMTEQR